MSDMSGHDAPERDELHSMTLRELEEKVAAAGVLISRRQLMRHCEKGTFIAKKLPATNNVDEWFIAPASVDKGIGDIKTLQELRARRDATHRDTSGHVTPIIPSKEQHDMSGHDAPRPDRSSEEGREPSDRVTSRHSATDLDIYEHPYVKRLELEVEKWEGRYEAQVHRTEEIQENALHRLVELQRMTTIGQSKTLADFMLQAKNWINGEAEDIGAGQEGQPQP
jgi:hypothetical protein